MIKLRSYQQKTYDAIMREIKENETIKLACFLPTGGGKSVIIGKLAQDLKGRTLILTNRIEILKQNSKWLGDKAGVLIAKENTVMYYHDVVIAMVETLNSRIKTYGLDYIGFFDNIIIDEAHINTFGKVYMQYDFKVLIGLTATPLFNKRLYKEIDGIKYSRQLVFGDFYDKIIQEISTQDLINLGYLVQEFNVVLQKGITNKLKSSNTTPDGYTIESLDAAYTNSASIKVLKEAYHTYGSGKKTMIFCPSTKVSKYVYDALKEEVKEIKIFDTRTKGVNRNELIKWYKETPGALLINVNVFTTGFDVEDVECIILNRATKSLSLYHQMVGRGSRITDKVLKEKFYVIDLGDNIYNHGIWSADIDWNDYFYPEEYKPTRSLDIMSTWDCLMCGNINPMEQFKCACGFSLEENKKLIKLNSLDNPDIKTRNGKLVPMKQLLLPNAEKIINYTRQVGGEANFAHNLAFNKIIELFKHYKVTGKFYNDNRERFYKRVYDIYRPIYFAILNSDLTGANRKLTTMINLLYKKINEIYS